MALIQPSIVVPAASGAIGNGVFVPSPFGIVLRQRVTPSNPNTPLQQKVRAYVGHAAFRWHSTLAPEQRVQWQTYADNTPWTGKFGQEGRLCGWNYFMAQHVLRRLSGTTPAMDGPQTFGTPASIGLPTVTATLTGITATFDTADEWNSDPNTVVLFSLSLPQPVTRRTRAQPYQYTDKIVGNATTPPASIQLTPLFSMPSVMSVCYLKAVLVDGEGRVSKPVEVRVTLPGL